MKYYPLLLDLKGKKCLVVGAGQVGRRKISTLLECGAGQVVVIDTADATPVLGPLVENPRVTFHCRGFDDRDIEQCTLVIACTDNEDVNWHISRLCHESGILCNIVDQPEKCSFILPALFTRGDLTLAVSTAGRSPALCKKIRRELKHTFGPEYGLMVELMGRLRPLILALNRGTDYNTRIFSKLVNSPLMDHLASGNEAEIVAILKEHTPGEIHPELQGLCHELLHTF